MTPFIPAGQTEQVFLMGEQYPSGERLTQELSVEERHMTEVYSLMTMRHPDYGYDPLMLAEVRANLVTAVKEAAMPLAISNPFQEYRDGNFMWRDGQTPEMVARSGYAYHQHPAAHARVDIEVAEAQLTTPRMLKPGFLRLMVSPAMSETDAPREVAKAEHLANEDMMRLHRAAVDAEGQLTGKYMPTVMLPRIPLPTWHAALRDLGKYIDKQFPELQNNTSALPIMQLHAELEFSEHHLPEGLVTVVEHILPHASLELRRQLEAQLLVMRDAEAQDNMHQKAESIAQRWLAFEVALSDSLLDGRATSLVTSFAFSLQDYWGPDVRQLIGEHAAPDGGLYMTKPLAIALEKARQNTLWVSAGVATGNKAVLNQLDSRTASQIYENEQMIEIMKSNGYTAEQIASFESRNNRIIAYENIDVGAGCAGQVSGNFAKNKRTHDAADNPLLTEREREQLAEADTDEAKVWEWKLGVCRVQSCHTRPGQTKVGPCAVCKGCQKLFDMGVDPTKRPPRRQVAEKQTGMFVLDFALWEKEVVTTTPKETGEKPAQKAVFALTT